VTLIALDDGAKLSGLQRIVESDADDTGNGNGGANDHNGDTPS
jgi:DNA gyrase subunit A